MKAIGYLLVAGLAIFLILSFSGCNTGGGGKDETCPEPTLDISLCDPDLGVFSTPTIIDNEFFPSGSRG